MVPRVFSSDRLAPLARVAQQRGDLGQRAVDRLDDAPRDLAAVRLAGVSGPRRRQHLFERPADVAPA